MFYPIESFTIRTQTTSFTFVRVAYNFGWFTMIDGKRYGDYLMKDRDSNHEEALENFMLLAEQATETVSRLKKLDPYIAEDIFNVLKKEIFNKYNYHEDK